MMLLFWTTRKRASTIRQRPKRLPQRLRHADEDQPRAGPRRRHGSQCRSARIADGPAQQQDAAEIALVRLARPPREPAAEPLRVHERNIRHFSFPHLPQCGLFRYDYNVPQKNSQIPGGFPLQPLKKYVKILAIQKKSCDRAAGCRMWAQRGCVAVSTPRRQCRPSPVSFRLNALRSMCSAAIRPGRVAPLSV